MVRKRLMVVGAVTLAVALSSGVVGAKEVANERASCVGLSFSDHASTGDYKGGVISEAVRSLERPGQYISGFASFHEGSHAACEPRFGETR